MSDWNTPLTLTAVTAGSTVQLTKVGSPTVSGLQYRTDSSATWSSYTIDDVITLANVGDYVQFQNTESALSTSYNDYVQFVMGGAIDASGNLQALLDYDDKTVNYCFNGLFRSCTALLSAPELPASVYGYGCYRELFRGCTAITIAPELPASNTYLGVQCFSAMFYGCSSLLAAPELNSMLLQTSCYQAMFIECTSMTTAPSILPATTLAANCYFQMFTRCSALRNAPELPAEALRSLCYRDMFNGCSKINSVKAGFKRWDTSTAATAASNSTYSWLNNVASSGVFYKPLSLPEEYGPGRIPEGWQVINTDEIECSPGLPTDIDPLGITVEEELPLTFKAVTDTTVELRATGSPITSGLKFRTQDGAAWSTYTPNTEIFVPAGKSIQFYNNDTQLSTANNAYVQFVFSGQVEAYGDCISLLNYSTTAQASCFRYLFSGCSGLLKAPKIGLVTLANYCCMDMFSSCTNLVKAPKLINTNLATSCFGAMFQGCTALKELPALPVTSLAPSCYSAMFYNCSSLERAPELPASTMVSGCYATMFRGCTSLTTAPSLPSMELAYQCYRTMFQECTSLSQAPALPATTLAEQCYLSMFSGCTALTEAPDLPATELVSLCYSGMFYNANNINKINVSFTAWDDSINATTNWMRSTAATGTFIKPTALPEKFGFYRIPTGWTVINKD